jgi:hypothetical protein
MGKPLTANPGACKLVWHIPYVKGDVHTNGLENFWTLFKRCIRATHVSVEPFHLFRYLDAQSYRYNNRKVDDAARFVGVIQSVGGKWLTYKALIGDAPTEGNTARAAAGLPD